MGRPKSSYISARDKFAEGEKRIVSGLLEKLGDRADIGWDNVRFNTGGLCDRLITEIAASVPMFRQVDDVTYVTFEGEDMIGPTWEGRLERQGCMLTRDVRGLLYSPNFKTSMGKVKVAILHWPLSSGDVLDMTASQAEAKRRGWFSANADLACFLRDSFSDAEIRALGLSSILVMHQPFRDGSLLRVKCGVSGEYLTTYRVGERFLAEEHDVEPRFPGLAYVSL